MSFHKATFYRDTYTVPLSHIERAVARFLVEEGPMTSVELARRLHSARSFDQGVTAVRVHINRLRAKLEPLGWTIPRGRGGSTKLKDGGHAYAVYSIRRIADAVE